MINSVRLQDAYINLYSELRNYIWRFDIIELIADLEVAVFTRFQNLDKVKSILNKLYSEIDNIVEDDEDLKEAFDKFLSILDDANTVYVRILNTVGGSTL